MTPGPDCPDDDMLGDFARGLTAADVAESLEAHVAGCPACGDTLRRLEHEGKIGAVVPRDAARLAPLWPADEARVVGELMTRLKRLSHEAAEATREFATDETPSAPRPLVDLGFLAPPVESDELGRFAGYRVLRVLGAGGMGLVFEVDDPQLGRRAALKVMHPPLALRPASRQRFLREARAAAAVDHDHLVGIFQVGEDQGLPFLLMPLLRGETLSDRLRRVGRVSPTEACRWGAQAAAGLAAAHAAGLVHRDLKPSNLWLETTDSGERLRILDFGLARAVDEESDLTQTGLVAGTPSYMAPEQADDRPIDARADLFSLGCVLYHLLTGRLAFPGRSPLAVLRALATHTPPPPHRLDPSVPRPLSSLVMKLLEKSPAARPQSAAEVAAALDTMGRHCAERPPRPRWRSRVVRALVVTAAAAGVAALLVMLAMDGNPEPNRDDAPPPPSAAPDPAADSTDSPEWRPVLIETFDRPDVRHGDADRAWGIDDGVWFEQVTGEADDGTYRSYGPPAFDFIAELRFRLSHARLAISFRPAANGPRDCHLNLDARPGGEWYLVRHWFDRRRRRGELLETVPLHREPPDGTPLFQPGDWTTLRITARGNRIRLEVNGRLLREITDPWHPQDGFHPNRYTLEIGHWLDALGTARLELDSLRLWHLASDPPAPE